MRLSAIARAQAAGDEVAELKSLSSLDLVEDSSKFVGVLVKWTAPFSASDMRYLSTLTAIGNNFCLSKLLPSIITFDGEAAGYDFPVPFFVIQGSDDNRTPPEAARLFVSHVRAPAKGYTPIDGVRISRLLPIRPGS